MRLMTPHKKIFARVLSRWLTKIPCDGLILEIGCGLGDWIEFISQPGIKIVGLDIDKQACTIAHKRVGEVIDGIVLYSGGIFPFKDDIFAGVYAHEVIEHVEDEYRFIAEAYRILKDGGSFILSTPNGNREPLDPQKHGAHVRHFTSRQLRSHLIRSGFGIDLFYWRMHPFCGLLDDSLAGIGKKILHTQFIQPGLTNWSTRTQTFANRFLLILYKFIEPMITFAVTVEYELFKSIWEARNMIFIVRKRT